MDNGVQWIVKHKVAIRLTTSIISGLVAAAWALFLYLRPPADVQSSGVPAEAHTDITQANKDLVQLLMVSSEEKAKVQRNLDEAVQKLSALGGKPDAPPGIDEALARWANGDTTAAEVIFKAVAEREKQNGESANKRAAEAFVHLGRLARFHDSDKARGAFREARELDPGIPLPPISIWNRGDRIRQLKKYGWRVGTSDKFIRLGMYGKISHDDVLAGADIIVSRKEEIDRLRQSGPDWREVIKKINRRCKCPIVVLDDSYHLSPDVGGTIYNENGEMSFYEPLEEWSTKLPDALR